MQGPLSIAFFVAVAGVFAILAFGIWNLVRKDEGQASRSNKLMRLRIIVQFIAILLIVMLGWISGAFKGMFG